MEYANNSMEERTPARREISAPLGKSENDEVITASDFRRMVRGAYSEFLLSADNLNALAARLDPASQRQPGTDILRTMGAAILPLETSVDDSIGGLARLIASAALLGARGTAGAIIASLFKGIAKGLTGHYEATSAIIGRAFQYGILYASRALAYDADDPDNAIVRAARAIAKNARDAVRANLPIAEILETTIKAAPASGTSLDELGAQIMRVFFVGCRRGIGGNFVSPALSFMAAEKIRPGAAVPPSPQENAVDIYCLTLDIIGTKINPELVKKSLSAVAGRVETTAGARKLAVHLHTSQPGHAIERAAAWGEVADISLSNMAEPHALPPARVSLLPVAVLAITDDAIKAEMLQEAGAHVIIVSPLERSVSIGMLVDACHSDLAASYIIVGCDDRLRLIIRQTKALMGYRVEIVDAASDEEQIRAIRAFDRSRTARDNAARMRLEINETAG